MRQLFITYIFFFCIIISGCNSASNRNENSNKSDLAIKTEVDSLKNVIDSLNYKIGVYQESYYKSISDTSNSNYLFYESQGMYVCGLATIKGYYLQKDREDFGDKISRCDCFVLTAGPKVYIDDLLKLIKMRNTLNFKNDKNQPVINIDTYKLTDEEIKIIKSSTIDKQIRLTIFIKLPSYTEVPICYSMVDIIKVIK
jgi:hypothetical protein